MTDKGKGGGQGGSKGGTGGGTKGGGGQTRKETPGGGSGKQERGSGDVGESRNTPPPINRRVPPGHKP